MASGAIAAETMEEVKRSGELASLADRLLDLNLISETALLEALMRRHSLPGGEFLGGQAHNPALRRLIPETLVRRASLVPVSVNTGILNMVCPDLPSEVVMTRLQMQIRLPLEFFLVTRSRYKEISTAKNPANYPIHQ